MNLIEQLKLHDEKIVEITRDCIELQIACMLLMHEACIRIKKDEFEDGLMMIAALYAVRESYNEARKEFLEVFNEDDVVKVYESLGGDRIVYTSIEDNVIRCNQLYFDIPPRPPGEEYRYNPAVSAKKRQDALHKYFPMLRGA